MRSESRRSKALKKVQERFIRQLIREGGTSRLPAPIVKRVFEHLSEIAENQYLRYFGLYLGQKKMGWAL